MASDEEPIYCLCRLPYDETRFMIECDVCKDWFHGSCVGVKEHQAADIEIYHCPKCTPKHGPLTLKSRRNWHRHDYSEDSTKHTAAVQTGTVVFVKELKGRTFPSAEEIPIKHLHGSQLTVEYFEKEGFDVPIVCEKKDGLGLTLPPASISIQDIEQFVGPMREIDVIDVACQEDIKMIMREWTEYYNSPNREKILNVISLEFSNTRLSEFVQPPTIVKQLSWARNVWPEQLPEGSNLARPEVQKYCLMGVKDSFTDFHIDFGGTSVWYHILRGEKVFYLVPPTQTNLMLYERWLSSEDQGEKFFGDQVSDCYRMVVKQGHTLFIPTGWIHAVLTPLDSLVFGGNFLHNYNIPLQLQCYEIERQVKTPEKYLFPSYETMNWYAAKQILEIIKDYTEENISPPIHLVNGAKALSTSLKAWTLRKDLTSKFVYAQVTKRDAADYIQYGKLLKDLVKEVKKIESMKKFSPKKADRKKKNEKTTKASKQLKGLEALEKVTKETLKAADKERRASIYNFEDEDDTPISLKVRIPKAGAYVAEGESSDTKGFKKSLFAAEKEDKSLILKKPKDEPLDKPRKDTSPKKTKKGAKRKESLSEEADKDIKKEEPATSETETPESSPVKEVPQCLKFKLSTNGKMVSTDRKPKSSKLKKEILERRAAEVAILSSPEKTKKDQKKSKSTEENSSNSDKKSKDSEKEKKKKAGDDKKRKKRDSIEQEDEGTDVKKRKLDSSPSKKTPDSSKKQESSKDSKAKKLSDKSKDKTGSDTHKSSKSKSDSKSDKKSGSKNEKDKKKSSKKEEVKTNESSSPQKKTKDTFAFDGSDNDGDSDVDQLVVDENPKAKKQQKTTSTTKPASLKLKLPPGAIKMKLSVQDGEQGKSKQGEEAIRGGLNGSISDILTASGYGSDTGLTDASGMRDAIAGMLTMSQLGEEGGPRGQVSASDSQTKELNISAAEEEEELMADCYADEEFVYPSFELPEDEEEAGFSPKKSVVKDDNWNPKSRVDHSRVKESREHRIGVQKASMKANLANTAAKLAEKPPSDRKSPKKAQKPKVPERKEFEVEPLPGPSTALDSDEPVNAFRPGVKRPVDPCANNPALQAKANKKPKKGYATAKQRLGKLLKIKKMIF